MKESHTRVTTALWLALVCVAAGRPVLAQVRNHHRVYLGTGEYDPAANWDGVLVFDRADAINGNQSPDRLVDMGTSSVNFGHMIYYVESRDELYVTSLFSNEISVFANASTMDGPQVPVREIGGPLTQLNEPHGLWIDESRDMLYVANRLTGAVIVFHNASTAAGNIAPNRSIAGPATRLDQPFNAFIDEAQDYLYVANANGPDSNRGVVIFHNASTVNGNVAPSRQIAGNLTPFFSTHPTVHNVFVDLVRDHLYVANHQLDVYVFHNASTVNGNVAADRTLSGFSNALGLFYLPDEDILYVSDGPGPVACSAMQQVKVFYNASTLSGAVGGSPDRVIEWSPENCTYYPPQPLAVQVTCFGGEKGKIRVHYGPGASDDSVRVSTITTAAGSPDPQANGVSIELRFDSTTLSFSLPGLDPRWAASNAAKGRFVWKDSTGAIGGVTLYRLKRRSDGEHKIKLLAKNIDLSTTAPATSADGEFDHGGAAGCSGTAILACTATATALKCD